MGYEPGWPQHITWAHPSGDTGHSHRCDGHCRKCSPQGLKAGFVLPPVGTWQTENRQMPAWMFVPTQRQSRSQ